MNERALGIERCHSPLDCPAASDVATVESFDLKVLYSCSERMLPLNRWELEDAVSGRLDAEAVACPSTAPSSSGGNAGGVQGASGHGNKLDSTSLRLLSLLRTRSYATFTPAQRMRLLRGLMDLASATGPIKEHLQVKSACSRSCG